MKNKLSLYLVLLFWVITINEILPQTWEDNEITEYFKNKMINDIAKTNNNIWLMDSEGYLYLIKNDSVKMYNIPRNVLNGELDDYKEDLNNVKSEKYGDMDYEFLSSNNRIIWLIQKNIYKNFLKIEGNCFMKFSCELDIDSNLEVLNHQVDDNGNLWILYEIYKNGGYYIFFMNADGKYSIKKLEFPYKDYKIKIFYVYKGNLHFIISIHDEKRDIYSDYDIIYSDNPEYKNYINEYLPNERFTEYKINFQNDSTFIIISSNGKIIYSDNFRRLPFNEFPLIDINSSCFWFAVANGFIYYTYGCGFYKYDIESNRLIEVIDYIKDKKTNYFVSPYLYDFKKIIYFNNCIWGLKCAWGEWGKSLCDVKTNGIKIYKLN